MEQATKLTAACYGVPKATSMLEARVSMQTALTGKPGMTCAPKLAVLPPTTEAFFENKRAHLQTFIWKNELQLDPHKLDTKEKVDCAQQNQKSQYDCHAKNVCWTGSYGPHAK